MTDAAAAFAQADDEVGNLPTRAHKREKGVVATAHLNASAIMRSKRIRIVLEENDNIPPTGQFIQLNGAAFILRPGEEVDVPIGLLSVLDDAVEGVPIRDNNTSQVIGYRKKLRFPYRVVGAVQAASR